MRARADREPLGGQGIFFLEVFHGELAQRRDRVGGDDFVLLGEGVDRDVGQVLEAGHAARLARVHVGPVALGRATSKDRVEHLVTDARDDLFRVEEGEHIGEIWDEQKQAGGDQDHGQGHAGARDKAIGDGDADPNRVDARDDEEAHAEEVLLVAEEHLRDARSVPGGGELNHDGNHGDGDGQHGHHHLR